MNLKLVPAYLKSSWYGAKFQAKKHSSEICLVSGIVSGAACVITTGIASTKVNGVLEEHKKKLEEVRAACAVNPELSEGKELTKAYGKTTLKIARLYFVPAVLGATSVCLILKSHNIMKRSNAILAATAAAAETSLDEYRKRVIEKYGEEVDQELSGNVVKKTVQKEVVNPETGEKTVESETITEWQGYSQWARRFGSGCFGWEDPRSVGRQGNISYVTMQEKALNDIMIYRHGYICVNDVYKQMGYPLVEEGWDWGVIWDPNGPPKQFNFCLRKKGNKQGAEFLNGESDEVWLDIDNVQYIRNKVLPKNTIIMEQLRKMNTKNAQEDDMYPRPGV